MSAATHPLARAGLALFSLSCGAVGGVSLPPEPVTVPVCGSAICESEIRYSGELSVQSPGDLAGLSITLCHRALCAERRPALILDTASYDCGFHGLLQASCQLTPLPASASRYRLDVAFSGPGEDYQLGDSFGVRISQTTTRLLDWTGTATAYRDERPAGEGCSPLCRYATLN